MSLPVSYTLQIKKVFLNFLQTLFSDASIVSGRYVWSATDNLSKIIIADKYSIDKPDNEKRPLIILSRNSVGPNFSTMKQRAQRDFRTNKESYMDILRGYVTLNCMAKNPIVAEELAHICLINLLAYRDKLKGYNGIHQILSIDIGQETGVLLDSNNILFNVPINIAFTKNIAFTPATEHTSAESISYTYSGTTTTWYEGINYEIYRNRIFSYDAIPSGANASITYLDNITLASTTETISGINGITQYYYLSGIVYAYNPMVHVVSVTAAISGVTYDYPYSGVLTVTGIDWYPTTNTTLTYSGYVFVSGLAS